GQQGPRRVAGDRHRRDVAPGGQPMSARARLGGALGLVLLGGAGALLVSGRAWQTVTAPRARPFTDEVVNVSGRTLEPAVAAPGGVALAGVGAGLGPPGIARPPGRGGVA